MLELFFTDVVRPAAGIRELHTVPGRIQDDIPAEKIRECRWLAYSRRAASRLAWSPEQRHRVVLHANRLFSNWVARADWRGANCVYGFNSACLEILNRARAERLYSVVDQISVPWAVEQRILDEERRRWPGWESAPRGVCWRRLAERERAEWSIADRIVCGSDFVVRAIREDGGPADKCITLRYGIMPEGGPPCRVADQKNGSLRILFVGTVELRKGIQYLMEAAKLLGRDAVEIRAVGPIRVSRRAQQALSRWMILEGPRPRLEVKKFYAWADVFVLPTLAEGSANVCYEAMAAGLPVVTTPDAGSVVRDGQEGFLVPPRDAVALAERLRYLGSFPDQRREMGQAARKRASEYSFRRYASALSNLMTQLCVSRGVKAASAAG